MATENTQNNPFSIKTGRSSALESATINLVKVHTHSIDPATNRRQYVIKGQELNISGLMVAIEVQDMGDSRLHPQICLEVPESLEATTESGIILPDIDCNDPAFTALVQKLGHDHPENYMGIHFHKIEIKTPNGRQKLLFCGILDSLADPNDTSDHPLTHPVQFNWLEVPDIFLK